MIDESRMSDHMHCASCGCGEVVEYTAADLERARQGEEE